MIANARMYSVTPQVGALWRRLLETVLAVVDGDAVEIVDHKPPAPISELWQRPDKAAVFMCGLPISRAAPRPSIVAAPVPSPAGYGGRPVYWTDLVVRADSPFETLEQTFGRRLSLTSPESQSGYAAPLHALMHYGSDEPLYREVIAPTFTPIGSLMSVIERRAEVAPLDSYAFALLQKHAPELTAQVRVVKSTEPTAIPALVASGAASAKITEAFLATDPAVLEPLLLERFVLPEEAPYDALRDRFEAATAFWRSRRLAAILHRDFATDSTRGPG
jgi:ABC-type phosphate/phosphonate transport system substrate-binding protein